MNENMNYGTTAGPAVNPLSMRNVTNTSNGRIMGTENSGAINSGNNLPATSSLPYSPFNSANSAQYQSPAPIPNRTLQPISPSEQALASMPETLSNPIYIPGFLRQNIGRWMRVEFLVGGNLTDRVGILTEVGASYILLHSIDPNSYIMCDLYAIKFAVIINTDNYSSLYADQ